MIVAPGARAARRRLPHLSRRSPAGHPATAATPSRRAARSATASELSYSDLARRVAVTVQSMHSTIATLVERGAIEVGTAERGRPARLRLTEEGHELLRTAGAVAHDLDGSLPLGDLDTAALRAALLEIVRPPGA